MEDLLCDEVWPSSPLMSPDCPNGFAHTVSGTHYGLLYTRKGDAERACAACFEKEASHMPEPGYLERLRSKNLVVARFRVIQWLIKSQRRLNLSLETVFNAANYLDRFISMNHCHDWKYWMVELLCVACLSVASKFSETSVPSFHEIQMEGLDHSFEARTIRRMELILLHTLGWRLSATTAYSYIELLTSNLDALKSDQHHHEELITQVTKTLLEAILDSRLLQFRPCTVAISALWCNLDELLPSSCEEYLTNISKLFQQDQKDELHKCRKIMNSQSHIQKYDLTSCGLTSHCPSSPISVLLNDRRDVYDCRVDLSIFDVRPSDNNSSSTTKRKREEQCS